MVIRHPIHDISSCTLKIRSAKHKGTRTSWLAGRHAPNRTSTMFRVSEVNRAVDENSDEEDGGYDGEESVAGTDTTDMSETNSLGSLTSVD